MDLILAGVFSKCSILPSFMAIRRHAVAAVPLGVAAAVCISAFLAANYQKTRRIASKQDHVDVNPVAVATGRRAPEDEQVFSLYGSVDAEPHAPPMDLSRSVLALLESFDVDPVRGESCGESAPSAPAALFASENDPDIRARVEV